MNLNISSNSSTIAALLIFFLFSCVPARQFEELKEKQRKCADERNVLSAQNKELETKVTELTAELSDLKKQRKLLVRDTLMLGNSLRKMTLQYDKINTLNDELLKKQSQLREGSQAENAKLMRELEAMKNDLLKKEDELKELESELEKKKSNLDKLSGELENREKRVKELENIIAKKDAAVSELKQKVTDALLGFQGKGLTVSQKNGKIYVSMEAKLLFAKGSTAIDPKGKKALVGLAKVLEDQKDISILVEGHTDTDKITGGKYKDNWDLSVVRATEVVRVMTASSNIDPKQLTAAGRGEFVPIDPGDTEKAKSKNRRIEVILTPNLDELFRILEPKE
ncbi:MAG: hypothetical protein COA57_01405 [Flavobacteriales bacterium]|nr:OmpA family protein [Bacteroidales bacterium AH-315-I05]PCJ89697.1 MAG: hypothetical protein COA57_01405 [Flavobacteriales bacterium]